MCDVTDHSDSVNLRVEFMTKDLCRRRVRKRRVGNQEKGDEESGVKGMIAKERRDEGRE